MLFSCIPVIPKHKSKENHGPESEQLKLQVRSNFFVTVSQGEYAIWRVNGTCLATPALARQY